MWRVCPWRIRSVHQPCPGISLLPRCYCRTRLIRPRVLLDAVRLDLAAIPIDLDYRTEMILRKAHLLADDWKIESPDLVRQLMPE